MLPNQRRGTHHECRTRTDFEQFRSPTRDPVRTAHPPQKPRQKERKHALLRTSRSAETRYASGFAPSRHATRPRLLDPNSIAPVGAVQSNCILSTGQVPHALTRQCLTDRRIGALATLQTEIAAWANRTNAKQRAVDWQFTIEKARTKLKRLYPKS